jgi:putative Mn2+ efflux pump MntP
MQFVAALDNPKISEALRTGAVFGIIEAMTPLIGWAAGVAASGLVQSIDHWIAFCLLAAVGGRMVYEALWSNNRIERTGRSLGVLAAAAVGTSLDAMAVGVSLAFLDVNIVVIALAVGLATFVLTTSGTLIGRYVGQQFGRFAEVAAGVALVLIGTAILIEHLTA